MSKQTYSERIELLEKEVAELKKMCSEIANAATMNIVGLNQMTREASALQDTVALQSEVIGAILTISEEANNGVTEDQVYGLVEKRQKSTLLDSLQARVKSGDLLEVESVVNPTDLVAFSVPGEIALSVSDAATLDFNKIKGLNKGSKSEIKSIFNDSMKDMEVVAIYQLSANKAEEIVDEEKVAE